MPVGDKAQIEVIHPPLTADGVSLREYMDTRLVHILAQDRERHELQEKAIEIRFKALELAVALARDVLDVRLATTNEWRKTVDDILKTAVTISTYNADVRRLQLDVVEAKALSSQKVPRTEYASRHEAVQKDIEDLKLSRAALAGKAEQSSVNVAMVLSVIGTLMGLVSLVLKIAGG